MIRTSRLLINAIQKLDGRSENHVENFKNLVNENLDLIDLKDEVTLTASVASFEAKG
jgi:hypothetical protein